ncbi:uncharacterized protein [Parasteatoda tepidariorum]|uniref:uncharacterized protein isoform X2 n=1 Tax=Parasteatoda tepidariorum TaxID=114398 RepID=UPI00077F97DC|nr:uncharacterized protein LOC107452112 isoform X2 [Parasteatoda tepidariorum]
MKKISFLSQTFKRMDSYKSSICWIVVLFIAEVYSTGKSLSSHRTSESNKIPWEILLDPNHRKPILNQTSRRQLPATLPSTNHYKILSQNQKPPTVTNSGFANVATFRPKQKFNQFPNSNFFKQQEKQEKHRRRKPEKRKPVDSGENFFPDYDDFESVNQHHFGYPQHLIPSDSDDYYTKAKDLIKLGSYGKPTYSSSDHNDGYHNDGYHNDGYGSHDNYGTHDGYNNGYSEEYHPYKSKSSKYVAFALGLLPLGLLLASLVPTVVTIPVSTAVATGRRRKRSVDKEYEI